MYKVYILRSLKDGSLYIGQTNNLDRRLADHNKGYSKFTKNRLPWNLMFFEELESRSEAVKLEKKLKSFKNKDYLLKYIEKGIASRL